MNILIKLQGLKSQIKLESICKFKYNKYNKYNNITDKSDKKKIM